MKTKIGSYAISGGIIMDTQTLKKSFALEGMILAVTAASLFAEPAKPVESVSPEKKFVVKVDDKPDVIVSEKPGAKKGPVAENPVQKPKEEVKVVEAPKAKKPHVAARGEDRNPSRPVVRAPNHVRPEKVGKVSEKKLRPPIIKVSHEKKHDRHYEKCHEKHYHDRHEAKRHHRPVKIIVIDNGK